MKAEKEMRNAETQRNAEGAEKRKKELHHEGHEVHEEDEG